MDAMFVGAGLPVDPQGFSKCLDTLKIGAAELWAVLAVETSGAGFNALRQPKILFERHIFSKETQGKFDAGFPDISNPEAGGYGSPDAQYDRLRAALRLERAAALDSASWGIGQVMGFNAHAAGYVNAEQMVMAMMETETNQLLAMANFLNANDLTKPLAQHDWPTFARKYNGPDFKKNQYDSRLNGNFEKFRAGPMPDLVVRAAQQLLIYLGYSPGAVDGFQGRLTTSALHEFLQKEGLPQSDVIDQNLVDSLRQKLG